MQARDLFLEGVEHEQNGKLYEAILQYKKALHLVPDIEFKVFNFLKDKSSNTSLAVNSTSYRGSYIKQLVWNRILLQDR